MSDESNVPPQPDALHTIAAIVVGFLLVIPSFFVGAIAVIIYMFFDQLGSPANQYHIIPFLSGIVIFLFQHLFPELIRGAVTGAVTIYLDYKIFKKAKKETVLAGILCGWLPIMAIVLFQHWIRTGPDMDFFLIVATLLAFSTSTVVTHFSITK